jgi:hypothetical protein
VFHCAIIAAAAAIALIHPSGEPTPAEGQPHKTLVKYGGEMGIRTPDFRRVKFADFLTNSAIKNEINVCTTMRPTLCYVNEKSA